MVNLTPVAVEKVKEILTQQNPVPAGLRVAVVGGGCSGFSYHMAFESAANENNDNIYGNVLTNGDTLDFRSALLGTNWDGLTSDVGNYLHVTQYDGDAIVSLSKTSGASGATVAYLHGAGTVSLSTLLAHSLV